MSDLARQLAGGDRRSISKANQVVLRVFASPERFADTVGGLSHAGPLIRMRCADAAEKVSKVRLGWLQPHKRSILALAARVTEKELRWHMAQMLPRLALTPKARRAALAMMFEDLTDEGRIVRTFAVQALADFAASDAALRLNLLPILEDLCKVSGPAVRSRGGQIPSSIIRPAVQQPWDTVPIEVDCLRLPARVLVLHCAHVGRSGDRPNPAFRLRLRERLPVIRGATRGPRLGLEPPKVAVDARRPVLRHLGDLERRKWDYLTSHPNCSILYP
jgi:hypothetical protein